MFDGRLAPRQHDKAKRKTYESYGVSWWRADHCALTAGLRLAGDQREIVVHDRNPEKVRALRRESQVEIARDLQSAVERR